MRRTDGADLGVGVDMEGGAWHAAETHTGREAESAAGDPHLGPAPSRPTNWLEEADRWRGRGKGESSDRRRRDRRVLQRNADRHCPGLLRRARRIELAVRHNMKRGSRMRAELHR